MTPAFDNADPDDVSRFVDAIVLGEYADAVFRERCDALGIGPEVRSDSPILLLLTASADQQGSKQ